MKRLSLFLIAVAMIFTMGLQVSAKDAASTTTEVKTQSVSSKKPGEPAKVTQVAGYTKKDGTVVKGYTKTKKATASDTTQVAGYTKKDGTVVKGYSRKSAAKSTK